MSNQQGIPDTEWHDNPKHAGKRTHIQKTQVTNFSESNPWDVLSDLPSNKTSQDIYTTPGIYEDIKITEAGPVGVSSRAEDSAPIASTTSSDISIGSSDIQNKFGDIDISQIWAPRLDMYKTSDYLVLEFELPGIRNPSLSWSSDKKAIILQSSKEKDLESGGANYQMNERHYGDFWRWVDLPTDVKLDLDSASATLNNAILKLKIKFSS